MTPQDLRILCTALGFTAIVAKGNTDTQGNARRAMDFAGLIESFCKSVTGIGAANDSSPYPGIDDLIASVKSDLVNKGSADMHKSRETLVAVYGYLTQRYATYAHDDLLADKILELLDAEIENNIPA